MTLLVLPVSSAMLQTVTQYSSNTLSDIPKTQTPNDIIKIHKALSYSINHTYWMIIQV